MAGKPSSHRLARWWKGLKGRQWLKGDEGWDFLSYNKEGLRQRSQPFGYFAIIVEL